MSILRTGTFLILASILTCIPSQRLVIEQRNEHLDSQLIACLYYSAKCLDIDFAIDDDSLSPSDIGLIVDNAIGCWEGWNDSGCDALIREVPSPKEPINVEHATTVQDLIESGKLSLPELPENPFDRKKKLKE